MAKLKAKEEYVQIDDMPWAPFPDAFSKGGITWRLLFVSPEAGTWTAVFECPAGSSFNAHFHTGPGEYFLYKGRMDVRGGKAAGGDTAVSPGYGFESSGAPRPDVLPGRERVLYDLLRPAGLHQSRCDGDRKHRLGEGAGRLAGARRRAEASS
jgi:hypothetical protein